MMKILPKGRMIEGGVLEAGPMTAWFEDGADGPTWYVERDGKVSRHATYSDMRLHIRMMR